MSAFCGFEVQNSDELGRIVVARKHFKIADLILDEPPLLISGLVQGANSLSYQNLPEDDNEPTFGCVGCFKALCLETVQFCTKCHWPVCSQACGDEPLHVKYECRLFEEKNITLSAEVYMQLDIIRGVLIYQDQDPTTWEQLSSVCFSYSLNQDDYLTKRAEKVERARDFFKQFCQMNVDPKIVDHIIGTCNTTEFGILGQDKYGNSYRAQAVYHLGSMFCHSCAPNATWSVLPYDYNGIKRWNLRIYARRNILCDESINISYMGDCFALDTAARRCNLKKKYHFDCKCSRCLDPSDFSFYTEAIICPGCGDETLTADDLSDERSKWTCNYCGVCKDYSFAKTRVEDFDPTILWYYFLQSTKDLSLTLSDENSGLNPNHRAVIDTIFYFLHTRSIVQFNELYEQSTRCSEMFVKLMETATKCLKVFRMFGSMANIVNMEWWFARMISAFYFKTVDFVSIPYDPYLPEEKLEIIKAICMHLKIAYNTMEWFFNDYLGLRFRQDLTDGYKFWNDELKALNSMMSGVDLSYSLEEKNENGVNRNDKVAQLGSSTQDFKNLHTKSSGGTSSGIKTSPNELSDPISKRAEVESEVLKVSLEMKKLAVRQSTDMVTCDIITDSEDSNLKPPLSLLKKYDFYFDS